MSSQWLAPELAVRLANAISLGRAGNWSEAVEAARRELPDAELVGVCALLILSEPTARAAAESFIDATRNAAAPTAEDLRVAAASLLVFDRRSEAKAIAERAVHAEPADAPGVRVLFDSAIACGATAEASAAADRLVELEPESAGAHDAIAEIRILEKRYEEARAAAERAVALSPYRYSSWVRLGEICMEQERFQRAIEAYAVATTLSGDESDFLQRPLSQALSSYEVRAARRLLPLTLAAAAVVSWALIAAGWRFFLWLGMPRRIALWLAIPPVLIIVPAMLSQLRALSLRRLPPGAARLAEQARTAVGERSGTSRFAGAVARIVLVTTYFGLMSIVSYRGSSPADLLVIAGFYSLIAVLGWLRMTFSRPDTYNSIRERS